MTKRYLILPLSAALASLSGPMASAVANTPSSSAAPADQAAKPSSDAVPVRIGSEFFRLTVNQAAGGTVVAQHASHASHASHHSHYSSRY